MSSSRSSTCAWATSTSRGSFISLRRRALAPLAWLTRLRRAALARRPGLTARWGRTRDGRGHVGRRARRPGLMHRAMVRWMARGGCARIAPRGVREKRPRSIIRSDAVAARSPVCMQCGPDTPTSPRPSPPRRGGEGEEAAPLSFPLLLGGGGQGEVGAVRAAVTPQGRILLWQARRERVRESGIRDRVPGSLTQSHLSHLIPFIPLIPVIPPHPAYPIYPAQSRSSHLSHSVPANPTLRSRLRTAHGARADRAYAAASASSGGSALLPGTQPPQTVSSCAVMWRPRSLARKTAMSAMLSTVTSAPSMLARMFAA